MLEVKLMFEFLNLIDIMKKWKSVINILPINYWSKFRRHFPSQRNSCTQKKVLAKVGPSEELIATPSC